ELAMRVDQELRGRRLERDAALRADQRVAEMYAAADAVLGAARPEPLDQRDGVEPRAVEAHGHAALELDLDLAERRRLLERAGREHPGRLGDAALRVERLGAADRDAPESAVRRIRRAARRHGHAVLLEVVDLRRALPRVVTH